MQWWGRLCALLYLGVLLAANARAEEALVRFDIPAAEARTGLAQFARQSSTPLLYMNQVLGSRRTNAVNGKLTVRQALEILLRHTGITGVINEAGVLTITVADPPNKADSGEITMQDNGNHVTRGAAFLAAVAAFFAAGFAAHAEDNVQAIQAESGKLEEIIVTAQKRNEDLQQVPISVQVIGSQALAEQNQNSLQGLAETLPGVNIVSRAGSDLLTIRGIGSGEDSGFDQSVAIFTDDIYHGRSRMSGAAFLDLDRIEVLKGPQSTFFGNDAIAGALNIVTKKPGDTFDAWGRALYGQFNQYAAEGAVGGPLTDTLGARLAITRNGIGKGWLRNEATGQNVPDVDNEAARLTLDFHPENLEATLKIEASDNKTIGSPYDLPEQLTNCPPPGPLTPSFINFGACAKALSLGIPTGLNQNKIFGLPGQGSSLSTFENVLTLNYHALGHTLTSVSGFYNYHYTANIDVGQLPTLALATFTIQYPEKYHQFSQEFRVASPTEQRLQYLAGVYYQTDRLDFSQTYHLPGFGDLGIPALAPFVPLATTLAPFLQSEQVYSIFGSLKWNITDLLSVNSGLRASRVHKDASLTTDVGTAVGYYGNFAPVPPAIQAIEGAIFGAPGTSTFSRTDHSVTPSVGIQYQIKPEAMVYASYNRGFKAGGFDGQGTGNLRNITFDPEHVNAYELGLKSKWRNDTVLLNVDVFRSDYQDLQEQANIYQPATATYATRVVNAAKAVSQGLELEARWAVSKEFQLGVNVSYLHAYFSDFPNAVPSQLETFCGGSPTNPTCMATFPNGVPHLATGVYVDDLTGQPTPYAPRWSGSVKAAYSVPLPHELTWTTEVSPYFTSSFNPDPNGLPGLQNNGYMRLDARLSLETSDGHWAIDAIGKNLTDRIIIAFPTVGFQSKEQPRNVAVQVRYHF